MTSAPPAPRQSPAKALFLDRDGVINIDKGYVHKIADCEFMPGIFDLCRLARAKGYLLIVITNQSGIARGYYAEKDFQTLMDWMREEFSRQNCPLDAVYHCPFHEKGIGEYRRASPDRKPEPGMILKAAAQYGLDLSRSMLIGDKQSDIEAGERAGVGRNILVNDSLDKAMIELLK